MPDKALLQAEIVREVERVIDQRLRVVISEELRDVVREVLASTPHKCRLDMTDSQLKALAGYEGRVKRLGDGDYEAGLDVQFENHMWLKDKRAQAGSLSAALFVALVTGSVGVIGIVLWEGVKAKIMGK